jgi:transcriptional regulator with XRE-family HTH domain
MLTHTQKAARVKADKKRRAGMRNLRKKLKLKQSQLAALAGVSQVMVARYERGKRVSINTDTSIGEALFRTLAKQNPERFTKAIQPALDEAEKWERVLSLEPGSEIALELEKRTGRNLAELKTQAETLAPFLRTAGNNFLSWAK